MGEGGHWYNRSGGATHEVPNQSKPGQTRPRTIKDVKKDDCVPSVSEIKGQVMEKSLVRYFKSEAVKACMRMPEEYDCYHNGELSDKDYINQMVAESGRHGREAAQGGTLRHAAVEQFFRGEDYDPEMEAVVAAVVKDLGERFPNVERWEPEVSFAHVSDPFAYGGQADLLGFNAADIPIVLADLKSQEFGPGTKDYRGQQKKAEFYWEWIEQLAAYAVGLQCVSITNHPINWTELQVYSLVMARNLNGHQEGKLWTPEECARGWECYDGLRRRWWFKNWPDRAM